MSPVVRVAICRRGPGLELDYSAPAPLEEGAVVRVPLKGRLYTAVVVEAQPADVHPGPLKEVRRVTGSKVHPLALELAKKCSQYFMGSRGYFLKLALPAPLSPSALRRPSGNRGPRPEVDFASGLAPARVVGRAGRFVVSNGGGDWLKEVLGIGRLVGRLTQVVTPTAAMAGAISSELSARGFPVARSPAEVQQALTGTPAFVVGTRASVFWPPYGEDLGAVVVVEADHPSHQEDAGPSWSSWRAAAIKAEGSGVPCLLLTDAPLPFQLSWLGVVPRTFDPLPPKGLSLWDLSGSDPVEGNWPPDLIALIDRFSGQGKVLVLVNTSLGARGVICRRCGKRASCPLCGSFLWVIGSTAPLYCGSCRRQSSFSCSQCGASTYKMLSKGVPVVVNELSNLLGKGKRVGTITSRVIEAEGDVIVATEAALSGRFKFEAVVMPYFDEAAGAPSPLAKWRAYSVAMRASRCLESGGVLAICTRRPDSTVIRALRGDDSSRLYEEVEEELNAFGIGSSGTFAFVSCRSEPGLLAGMVRGVHIEGPDLQGSYLLWSEDPAALSSAIETVFGRSGSWVFVEDVKRL